MYLEESGNSVDDSVDVIQGFHEVMQEYLEESGNFI